MRRACASWGQWGVHLMTQSELVPWKSPVAESWHGSGSEKEIARRCKALQNASFFSL